MSLPRVTLTNESITFTSRGIWIQPLLSNGFWFQDEPFVLLSILVAHPEVDIDNARFYIREN